MHSNRSRGRRLLAATLRRLADRLAPVDPAPGQRRPDRPPVAGPPADWLERVRRGAPELLQPGMVKAVEARPSGPQSAPDPPAATMTPTPPPPRALRPDEWLEARQERQPTPAEAVRPISTPSPAPVIVRRYGSGWTSGEASERRRPESGSGPPAVAPSTEPPPPPTWSSVVPPPHVPQRTPADQRPFPPAAAPAMSGTRTPQAPPARPAGFRPAATAVRASQPAPAPPVLAASRLEGGTIPDPAPALPAPGDRLPTEPVWPGTASSSPQAALSVVEVPHLWPELPAPEPPDGEEGRMARAALLLHEHERRLEREQRG